MERNTIKKAIEILQNADSFVCESLIKDFVWANTTEPQFKVGDAVEFSDSSTGILRHKYDNGYKTERKSVKWAIGRITEVRRVMNRHTFQYTVEYETDLEDWEVSGRNITAHKAFPMEGTIRRADAYRVTLWKELDGRKKTRR